MSDSNVTKVNITNLSKTQIFYRHALKKELAHSRSQIDGGNFSSSYKKRKKDGKILFSTKSEISSNFSVVIYAWIRNFFFPALTKLNIFPLSGVREGGEVTSTSGNLLTVYN